MIIFHKIRWKNLMSFGETPTEVLLDTGKMTAIRGKNSSGKSVFLEAINFVLFGKPFRKINKPKLVNIRNGRGLLVEIWFDVDGKSYYIKRGISPGIFEIYVNDILMDQSSDARDYQQYLEKNILGIDYNAFNQIVVLGKASYTSFMRLSLDNRRKFIESMLDLNIFSLMLDIHRKNVTSLKNEIQESKINYTILKEKIELQEKHLGALKQSDLRQREEYTRHIDEQVETLEAEVDILEREISELEKTKGKSKHDIASLTKKISSLESLIKKAHVKMNIFGKELSVLDSDNCPTCGQGITEEFRQTRKTDITSAMKEVQYAELEIVRKIDKIKEDVSEEEAITEYNKGLDTRIREINYDIQSKRSAISRLLKNKGKSFVSGEITNEIHDVEESLKVLRSQSVSELDSKELLLNRLEEYEVVTSLLGDGGIRKTIIRTFLPLINKSVNGFLVKLNFPVRFTLSEDFSEEINTRGTVTGYYSCSEGEKEKIDIGLLLAWRDVAKIRSRFSCNMIVFDEMFDSSLDISSIDSLISILRDLNDTSIFVITHSNDYSSEFDNTIFAEKQANGFSKYTFPQNDNCGIKEG